MNAKKSPLLKIFLIFSILFLLLASLFLTKDILIKKILTHHLDTKYHIKPNYSRLELRPDHVALQQCLFTHPAFSLEIGLLDLTIHLKENWRLQVKQINLAEGFLKINQLEQFLSIGQKIFAQNSAQDSQNINAPPQLFIEQFAMHLNDHQRMRIHGLLDFQGIITQGWFKQVKHLEIDDLSLKSDKMSLKAQIFPKEGGLYILKIKELIIKNKSIADLLIDFEFDPNQRSIFIKNVSNQYVNPEAQITGTLDLTDIKRPIMALEIKNLFLNKVIEFFDLQKDIVMEGIYDGQFEIEFDQTSIGDIKGNFANITGGVIHIKNETSLDFLLKYIDKKTYDILVDNLKNYSYAIGNMSIQRSGSSLILDMDFKSDPLGKREIVIDFHDLLGGSP